MKVTIARSPLAAILVTAAAGLTVSLAAAPLPPVTDRAEIRPAFISSTERVFAPTIAAGAVEVRPAPIASSATVFAPTVQPGGVFIDPAFIASTAFVPSPRVERVDPGAVVIHPAFIPSAASVFEPSVAPGAVTVSPALIEPTSFVLAPEVRPGAAAISPAFIPSGAFVPSPVVQPGPVTIAPAFIDSTAFVAAPSVQPGPVPIAPAFIASTAFVLAPTVSAPAAAVFTDDFAGDAQLGDRTGWTFLFGNPATAVTSGGILRTVNTAESGWSARDTGSTDHYAQATLRNVGTNGPLVCVDVQDLDNWIGVRNSASAYSIIKKVAGTVSVVVNVGGVTPALGDVFRMEIRGRDLTFLVNGTTYWSGSLAANELAGVTKAGIVARTAARTDWIKPWSSGKL